MFIAFLVVLNSKVLKNVDSHLNSELYSIKNSQLKKYVGHKLKFFGSRIFDVIKKEILSNVTSKSESGQSWLWTSSAYTRKTF
jgi:hypothetical protein